MLGAIPHPHSQIQAQCADLAGASGLQSLAETMFVSLSTCRVGTPLQRVRTAEGVHVYVYCSRAEARPRAGIWPCGRTKCMAHVLTDNS